MSVHDFILAAFAPLVLDRELVAADPALTLVRFFETDPAPRLSAQHQVHNEPLNTIRFTASPDLTGGEIATLTAVVGAHAGVADTQPAGQQHHRSAHTIDCTVTGATLLFVVPPGKAFQTLEVTVRLTSIVGFTSVPTVGVGVAAGEDDIEPSQALTGLDAINKAFTLHVEGVHRVADPGDSISFGVDVAAVATTYEVSVDVWGTLI